MEFVNSYENDRRAEAYARMAIPGTYHLAFRDLPALIKNHVTGTRALDFGCGAGRSTRFVRNLGFETIGIDISPHMLKMAHQLDPSGDYRLVQGTDYSAVPAASFDLITSLFTFDNIAGAETKAAIFTELGRLVRRNGRMINVVSTPEMYTHEWASFSTKNYPENHSARPGDIVRVVTTAIEDPRPVDDIIWPDDAYRRTYTESGWKVLEILRPLATGAEPIDWVSETTFPPWSIYLLGR